MKLPAWIALVMLVVLPILGGLGHAKWWPCPQGKPDPTIQLKVDSITRVNAQQQAIIDSLFQVPPVTIRVHEQLRTSTSLGLDSLRAVLLADPI